MSVRLCDSVPGKRYTHAEFESVQAGFEWLKSTYPEGLDRVMANIERLQMNSSHYCVLGLVLLPFESSEDGGYDFFYDAIYKFFEANAATPSWGHEATKQWMIQHGFESHLAHRYDALADAWHNVLFESLV